MKVITIMTIVAFSFGVPAGNYVARERDVEGPPAPLLFLYLCIQLPRSLAVTMEMFVLLTGQTREREGWRCALEECGEPCVILGA